MRVARRFCVFEGMPVGTDRLYVTSGNGEQLEHRMGFEPMNTGFADQRVSHFAIGALEVPEKLCNLQAMHVQL
jgi:hypothetical protein